jgi:GT2 family glycosyltransferase
MMKQLTTSVLIPSFRRPQHLNRCLRGLATQTQLPDEVIVVWQAEDTPTRDVVQSLIWELPYTLNLLHCAEAGVVPAENVGLSAAKGEIIVLCDDDTVAPAEWLARHLSFYIDPSIGAVGGSANNHHPDGSLFPKRNVTPIGKLTWYGKLHGNMHDQVDDWISKPPLDVDHLVGYNLSVRRAAFDRFESGLKAYWQLFELDLCLQVKARGYRVVFDFANHLDHYPTNTAFTSGRHGDLQIKIFNGAYNHAFIIAKHSPRTLMIVRLLYIFCVGIMSAPGLLATLWAIKQNGNFYGELDILYSSWSAKFKGWLHGWSARKS